MKLSDSIDIDADPDSIWPFLAIPQRMALWNSHVIAVERSGEQPVQMGERFTMTYKLSGPPRQSEVEVVQCQPPLLVAYQHRFMVKTRERSALESYELRVRNGTTRLRQTLDLGDVGIPWIFRPLIWWIHHFGRTVGESFLEELKRLVQNERIPS
jgi:hypothetical protein